jgi:hypothetical protein
MVQSKLFLYGLCALTLLLLILFMSGCLDRGDMSQQEAVGIVKLDKELRK